MKIGDKVYCIKDLCDGFNNGRKWLTQHKSYEIIKFYSDQPVIIDDVDDEMNIYIFISHFCTSQELRSKKLKSL